MTSSLRIRLTFWYSLVLSASLIASAILFYFLVEQAIQQIADDSLEDAIDSVASRLKSTDESDESIEKILADFRFQYTVFAIYEEGNKEIAASPRLQKDTRLRFPTFNISTGEIPPEVLAGILSLPGSHETFLLQNKTRVRIYGEKVKLDSREVFVVALRPLTNQTELLSNIRFFGALIIPLVLLFASAAGYYLAKTGLAPVREIGEKAMLITSQNLNERLPDTNKTEEVEALASSFNEMLTRLEASFESQRRFMSDASHELRTPLVIVRGEAEVALQKESRPEPEYRESLEIIRQEGVRLSHIVEDLFILARADANQQKLNPSSFYLDEVVDECSRALRTLISAKNIQFDQEIGEGLIFSGDETLIRRLIIILLDNAIKYSETNGKVSLKVRNEDSTYRIQVSNTGTPIAEEEQERIFDRFYRGDKVRSFRSNDELGTGAGLGLAIGSWIAKAHDGRFELASSNYEGTIFIVTLPKKQENAR